MASIRKIGTLLEMIKFEHTVFALPFAYLGMVLGARGLPPLMTVVWITMAMVGARTFAMTLNRLYDRHIDARNPRTSQRALPRGLVSPAEALGLLSVSLVVFFGAVLMLPDLCHSLWPFVLVPMALYSLTKRFTALCHLVLGLCLGLAPLGAWVATTNTLPPLGVVSLGAAVACWTAGFDIIYSCQDVDVDRRQGLHSLPARLGIGPALVITRALHGLTVVLLALSGAALALGPLYYLGVTLVAASLWYENSIVSPGDLSRVDAAFFTVNGFVSIAIFCFAAASICFHL